MNSTTLPDTNHVQAKTQEEFLALSGEEVDKRACGRITMWSLNGDITVESLTAALKNAGSVAIPPEEPSALVALNRAVQAGAKSLGHLDVHHKGRGEWVIVGKGVETADAEGKKSLSYPISCTAKVTRDPQTSVETLEINGEGADKIRGAYEIAKHTLAPADIGTWLCEKLTALKAIPLRDRGGIYFVPQPVVVKWQKIQSALTACSAHHVHTIPALKSKEAIQAILSALTSDTRAACGKIAGDVAAGELGNKALDKRQREVDELLDRVAAYEGIVGQSLGELRDAIDETKRAIAVAVLAASAE